MAFGITVAILSIVNFEFEFRVALACGLFLWPSGFEHIHIIQFIRQQMAKWFSWAAKIHLNGHYLSKKVRATISFGYICFCRFSVCLFVVCFVNKLQLLLEPEINMTRFRSGRIYKLGEPINNDRKKTLMCNDNQ